MPIKSYITKNSASCQSENTIAEMFGLYILKQLNCVLQSYKFVKLNCLLGSELNGPFKLQVHVGQCSGRHQEKGKNLFDEQKELLWFPY